jgi:predicted CXXCH cytochrome family protein
MCVCAIITSPALALITGSTHDFSDEVLTDDAWNPNEEICQPCHAPHGNQLSAVGSPMWNKTESAEVFTAYTSVTFTAKGLTAAVDGTSKLCMSCHDGATDLESFGGNTAVTNTLIGTINADLDLGNNLSTSHPIGFDYPLAGNAEIKASTEAYGPGTIADALFGDKMECATCHDVHDTGTAPGSALLRVANDGSAMCLACHIK